MTRTVHHAHRHWVHAHWPRWITIGLLLCVGALTSSSCSNRAEFVCDVLDSCELLEGSIDQCIDGIGLAYESEMLLEDEVGHCLDCIVEHSCQDIDTICREEACHNVLEAIEQGRQDMGGEGGEGGQAGEGGAP